MAVLRQKGETSARGHSRCPLPSPVWHFHPLREVPGVVLTCRVVCLLPLFKAPGDALEAVSEEEGGHQERALALSTSPASSGLAHDHMVGLVIRYTLRLTNGSQKRKASHSRVTKSETKLSGGIRIDMHCSASHQ